MTVTAAKKHVWTDILFVAGGMALIAAAVRLFARCGLTC